MDIADQCCGGKVVATLEGGYHISGLAESIKATLIEMKDGTHVTDDKLDRIANEADSNTDPVIKKVIDQINPYWRLL
jgi:acetoin utilization deacetylase AcuC-like enzyme